MKIVFYDWNEIVEAQLIKSILIALFRSIGEFEAFIKSIDLSFLFRHILPSMRLLFPYGKNEFSKLFSGGFMAEQQKIISMTDSLSNELVELFDMKKARIREAKELTLKANEAQRDIRLLSLMFRDGIPDITMSVNDTESIRWCERSQQLIYMNGDLTQLLDATSKEVRVRMRPFLKDLVKKAKDFYNDNECLR